MEDFLVIRYQSGGYSAWITTLEKVEIRITGLCFNKQEAYDKAIQFLRDPAFRKRWHNDYGGKYTLPVI